MPEVRLITPITRQSTKKMQVAAYCRVSSNSADQLNSYAAQIRAYKKYIGARDDWELVDIFADEGLTGMKSETRDEFQRMIRMCELKQIEILSVVWIQSHDSSGNEPPFEYPLKPLFSNRYKHRKTLRAADLHQLPGVFSV